MLRKKRNSIIPLESAEQIALFEWAAYHPILSKYLLHIPMGGKKETKQVITKSGKTITICPAGRKEKFMGAKKGTPDIFLCYPSRGYHGFWIELKRADKKLSTVSDEQVQFILGVRTMGYRADVLYGWDAARVALLSYLSTDPYL